MPFAAVEPYATFIAERFRRFNPVFFISGDTRFESPDEIRYYMKALETVKRVCPEALLSMHLHPQGDLPNAFVEAVDFYMFQSGHGANQQDQAYTFAEKFAAYPVARPVLNSEPAYEGHGRIGERSRFDAFDIRKATWQSLLAGAKMGIGYGAHGVWSFHRQGTKFLNAQRSFEPFDWDEALQLDGGWDVAYAKWIWETYDLFDVEPAAIIGGEDPEIRAAANSDRSKVAIYAPYAFDIVVDLDLTGYRCRQIDLASRRVMVPKIEPGAQSQVGMSRFNTDTLFLAIQEK